MNFSLKPLSCRKRVETFDFLTVSALRTKGQNCPLVTYCFYIRFRVAAVSPLKGPAVSETAVPIRGMRGRV